MTLSLSQANTYAPATKEESSLGVSAAPVKKTWKTILNRFWGYTEATSECNTKSFEGLL